MQYPAAANRQGSGVREGAAFCLLDPGTIRNVPGLQSRLLARHAPRRHAEALVGVDSSAEGFAQQKGDSTQEAQKEHKRHKNVAVSLSFCASCVPFVPFVFRFSPRWAKLS